MRIEWFGQSTFSLKADGTTVVIDPFGDMATMAAARGMKFDYPLLEDVTADVLMVTHEHLDHNGVETVGGDPVLLRSTAGTHASPIGEVIGVASEHDDVAGTQRGPNTIFVFSFGGLRIAHFGDFGQPALRPEQQAAIGEVDLVFMPVGGGMTIGGADGVSIAAAIGAKWIVPMHYRTERISFLDDEAEFVKAVGHVVRLETPVIDTAILEGTSGPLGVIPATP